MKILIVKMADTLVAMYHGRIKYPWQEKDERAGRRSRSSIVAAAPLSKPPASGGSESGKGSSKPN